ncbi:MAG: class I SAM-dependent methyltransferase [Bdellovibrionales bacterium]|nr:class I SAM-dependent methyltransferase [Bdellovibrionales bacterium]
MRIDPEILSQAQRECNKAGISLVIEDQKFMIFKKEISQKPYGVDFTQSYYLNLIKKKPSKKQPLAKALGVGSTVLDLSAGTLKDSFYMASLGFKVTALERSPTVFLLLKSAINELSEDSEIYKFICERINILYSEAIEYFELIDEKPDVIYFDPMFPDKKKQALSQKSMQLFKALLPADEVENKKIANKALSVAKKRFVTKRPLHAEALTPIVTQRYIGKSIRYDMVSTV